jgi:hypothetical protein
MRNIDTSIRIAAFAIATLLVTGTTYALGSYSDAKFAAALGAADGLAASQPTNTAIAPARIDVVGKRNARTAA